MKIEVLIIIFLVGLNVGTALSQNSLNIENIQENVLKERILELEKDVAVINVSKEYFLVVISAFTGLVIFVALIAIGYNFLRSQKEINIMVKNELAIVNEGLNKWKEKNSSEMDDKLEKNFLRLETQIFRVFTSAHEKNPQFAYIWALRTAENYSKTEDNKYCRQYLVACYDFLKKIPPEQSIVVKDYYNEIITILNSLNTELFGLEIEKINNETKRLYLPDETEEPKSKSST